MATAVLTPHRDAVRGPPPLARARPVPGRALLAIPETARAGPLARALEEVGLLPSLAFTPPRVLASLDAEAFDLILLHLRLARPHPEAFLRALRDRTDAALLALGGQELAGELLLGPEVHALVPDDAPPEQVAARAAALLGLRGPPDGQILLRWGPLELDLARRRARWSAEVLELTPLQLRILAVLVRARGAVATSRDISHLVWGTAVDDDTERVYSHIRRIRRKIEADPSHPRFLLTVRGEGFRLAEESGSVPGPASHRGAPGCVAPRVE
jgi:two-component system response regulator RegX3